MEEFLQNQWKWNRSKTWTKLKGFRKFPSKEQCAICFGLIQLQIRKEMLSIINSTLQTIVEAVQSTMGNKWLKSFWRIINFRPSFGLINLSMEKATKNISGLIGITLLSLLSFLHPIIVGAIRIKQSFFQSRYFYFNLGRKTRNQTIQPRKPKNSFITSVWCFQSLSSKVSRLFRQVCQKLSQNICQQKLSINKNSIWRQENRTSFKSQISKQINPISETQRTNQISTCSFIDCQTRSWKG